jgi:myo-inositol-1(or 4)-monophosphatase
MVNAVMVSIEQKWLHCAARMAEAGRAAALPLYGTAAARSTLGRGAGGDETLEIDRACERAILGVLDSEAPSPHVLVSEEAGIAGPLDAPWRVVIDPLDGSLNAKRGLEPFGASIAVASGSALRDVRVAYVEDYTRARAYAALKQGGLLEAGTTSEAGLGPATEGLADPERFSRRAVELVFLEASRPDGHRFAYADLNALGGTGPSESMRIRQIGSLALSLCYVAVGVADILFAAVNARSVDIAAGLLILAEAGGRAAALDGDDLLGQPLDLKKRSPFVAWRAGLDGREIVDRCRGLLGL